MASGMIAVPCLLEFFLNRTARQAAPQFYSTNRLATGG